MQNIVKLNKVGSRVILISYQGLYNPKAYLSPTFNRPTYLQFKQAISDDLFQ